MVFYYVFVVKNAIINREGDICGVSRNESWNWGRKMKDFFGGRNGSGAECQMNGSTMSDTNRIKVLRMVRRGEKRR